ncbi:MAG: 30S ribosomal protein S9 [Armatimonadetes bacterium CG07_land_8_20_14_0_80_40_9]|nr:MAG: 30S ribosomal protein S9 [Armatimonadetes bacterium CG07_land_8_20_14_0_80_40_9]
MEKSNFHYATGRQKEAIAKVRLFNGEGKITVNEQPFDKYFGRRFLQVVIKQPLELTQLLSKFDVIVKVKGGGTSGQAGAIRLGIARALLKTDENLRPLLRKEGMLTRDPRVKERKKYGQKRARKRFQYSKR